jgi:hypothetical protein
LAGGKADLAQRGKGNLPAFLFVAQFAMRSDEKDNTPQPPRGENHGDTRSISTPIAMSSRISPIIPNTQPSVSRRTRYRGERQNVYQALRIVTSNRVWRA